MSRIVSACKTVLPANIAKKFTDEIISRTSKLTAKPTLVGFLANDDPAARVYADWTSKTCDNLGFKYKLIEVNKEDLENKIYEANQDDKVNGIMVYFPVFGDRQDQYLQQCVSMDKDVEGLNFQYISNMYHNIRFLNEDPDSPQKKSILPCTPLAVVKILEHLGIYNTLLNYGDRLYGKTITIVNRSEIVGRPLAALLANDGATVYSVDLNKIQVYERGDGLHLKKHVVSDTDMKLKECALKSDVIITGVPSKTYKFPTEYVKRGAVCVNFASEKNFDDEIKNKASLYVPNVGKVTITMLLRNLLRLMDNKASKSQNQVSSKSAEEPRPKI